MGWGKFIHSARKLATPKNIATTLAIPATGGLSLLAAKDNSGKTLLGEITGKNAAKEANEQNIALQNATNEQSINLANSAHQREIADLKAAGLNPVLSAGGTGAATPTLGTAQVQNTLPGGYLAQAQSAGQVASLFSSAKQMTSQAKLNKEQAGAVDSQVRLNKAQAKIAEDQDEFYQDTGYWPGATEGQNTTMHFGPLGGGHNQTTPIRNPKKGNSAKNNQYKNNYNEMDENYDRTEKKRQERINKLKEMGWHKSMTTH